MCCIKHMHKLCDSIAADRHLIYLIAGECILHSRQSIRSSTRITPHCSSCQPHEICLKMFRRYTSQAYEYVLYMRSMTSVGESMDVAVYRHQSGTSHLHDAIGAYPYNNNNNHNNKVFVYRSKWEFCVAVCFSYILQKQKRFQSIADSKTKISFMYNVHKFCLWLFFVLFFERVGFCSCLL